MAKKKSLDDLAKTMAAGFRAMKNEAHGHRVAVGQLQEAVIGYSRKVEERDEARLKRIADLEDDVAELKRKVQAQ